MNDLATYEDVGFIKYSGKAVPDGVIDAGSAGMALIGLNKALRFFNERQSPAFAKFEYEIPIRTAGGAWTAFVLAPAGTGTGTDAFAPGYLPKVGATMAHHCFQDVGLSEVLKKSMSAMQHLVKLVKHTRLFKDWSTSKVSWRDNGKEIGIANRDGKVIFIPTEFFHWYGSLPRRLIHKMTVVIKAGRVLTIGLRSDGVYEEVTVDEADKVLFAEEQGEDGEEFLFPELDHGSAATLEGKLVRCNEASNSLGFEYHGHMLNCIPDHGNVRRFKQALFLKCVIEGTVTRLTKQRHSAEKRPTVILRHVTTLEDDNAQDIFKDAPFLPQDSPRSPANAGARPHK